MSMLKGFRSTTFAKGLRQQNIKIKLSKMYDIKLD